MKKGYKWRSVYPRDDQYEPERNSPITSFNPAAEAAAFYRLWLRGWDEGKLREDIGVSPAVLAQWRADSTEHRYYAEAERVIGPQRARTLELFDQLIQRAKSKGAHL